MQSACILCNQWQSEQEINALLPKPLFPHEQFLSAIASSKLDGKMFAELTDDDLKEHFLMLFFS